LNRINPWGSKVNILSIESFSAGHLLSKLRQTRLRGFDGAQPYANASLELVHGFDTSLLAPAQNYVLTGGVDKILALRAALLPRDVDILSLDGGVHVVTSDDPAERIPVIPPIVEESRERDGRAILLINDGMHRCYAARRLGLPISAVVVRDVPSEYPYYAYPLDGGWSGVSAVASLSAGHMRKVYRNPDNYKALFRDFNAIFPGVQKDRKHVDPAHIMR
jgi:hypothetical protein